MKFILSVILQLLLRNISFGQMLQLTHDEVKQDFEFFVKTLELLIELILADSFSEMTDLLGTVVVSDY